MKLRHDPAPGPLRAKAYPQPGEQLDALWKIVNALIEGQEIPADALAVRDAVAQVKNKFRKRS